MYTQIYTDGRLPTVHNNGSGVSRVLGVLFPVMSCMVNAPPDRRTPFL